MSSVYVLALYLLTSDTSSVWARLKLKVEKALTNPELGTRSSFVVFHVCVILIRCLVVGHCIRINL